MMQELYYDQIQLEQNHYYVVASSMGLAFIGTPNEDLKEVHKFYKKVKLSENNAIIKPYAEALARYFAKESRVLNVPLDVVGTEFQQRVWQMLQMIPYGETRSYSEVAQAIGAPTSVRAVANAVGRNPVMIAIPCHRVLGKNGSLTGFRGGLALKQTLLDLEQVKEEQGDIRWI